jgi:L-rhamnose mutarotase
LQNTNSVIRRCGRKCWLPCGARVGIIIRCSCATTVYFEAEESFQASLDGMALEEVNRRWQDFMADYFEGLGGEHADRNMQELEEVFHLN